MAQASVPWVSIFVAELAVGTLKELAPLERAKILKGFLEMPALCSPSHLPVNDNPLSNLAVVFTFFFKFF